MTAKKLTEYPVFDRNPFEPEGVNVVSKGITGAQHTVFNEDGKMFILTEPTRVRGGFLKDMNPYRKIFSASLDRLKDLSAAGFKVLCYVMANIDADSDKIRMEPKNVCEYCGWSSRSQFYNGVLELLDKGIVVRCQGDKCLFYINVNIFFNGDRTKLKVENS